MPHMSYFTRTLSMEEIWSIKEENTSIWVKVTLIGTRYDCACSYQCSARWLHLLLVDYFTLVASDHEIELQRDQKLHQNEEL